MAVVLKINPGFDASYPWREIGTGVAAVGGASVSPLEYYLAPADKGGEPLGRWTGRGLSVLGFKEGQVIDRKAFEPLFGQHADPRDESGKTRLGRAPQRFAAEDDIYRELLATEPHASEARKAELRSLARAQTRHAVPFWDITVSVSKSITLFYGGLLARAEYARQAGDRAGADRWEHDAARVWQAIMEGNAAALTYLQDEAGVTRTGYHRGTGAETMAELGKWEQARDWVIGSFRQHTSRTGDPQLHVHNLVLAKVLTERDGRWRKLDSKALYRFQGAAAAVAAAVTESALTRELGVMWVPRRDGHGREIAGIGQEMMDAFSSRRQTITDHARRVAEQRQQEHGRPPDARQMHLILRDIALRTRPPKHNEPLDLRASLRDWEETARARDLGELAAIPDAVAEAASQARHDAPDSDAAQQAEPAEDRGPGHPLPGAVLRVAHDMAEQFTSRHDHRPEPAQLRSMERFAGFATLRGTDTTPVDAELLLAAWERQEQRDAEAQAELRRLAGRAEARAGTERAAERAQERARKQERLQVRAYARPAQPRTLAPEEARQLMAEAVWTVQNKMATWTKADLIRHIGEALPAHAHADRATLETLADRAIGGGGGEPVALLFAPEWPRVPDCLRRSDGESVFRPHGAERYASQAQLTLEEQLVAQAQAQGAPRLDPDLAARLLGAGPARLEAALRAGAHITTAAQMSERTGSGLRVDQAAAAYFVATSPRRTEVMIGPPGTGKTRTAVELARMWTAAGIGPAIALTTSSNARNVIRDEAARHGVTLQAYNTAEWLGHSERARESRHPVPLAPGTLISVDEASMMPLADLAAIQRRATQHGAKVVITGDPMQLQAVESGGGMTMAARRLGHVQLSEAGRFRHAWEAEASLRLRDGDVTVLAEYRERAGLSEYSQRGVPETAVAEEVLGACLARDGQQLSATDTREAAWSDADRLDVLSVQWQHVIRETQQRRYEAALRGSLTADQANEVLADSAATWLWRSLREAEAAGLDGHKVLRRAVSSGQLEDAESVAKVIDWRIRQQITGMPAIVARPWLDQMPQTGDADLDRYARELAEAMDGRQRRLGEHAAEHQPAWSQSLGPVPEHPLDRAEWEHRASQVRLPGDVGVDASLPAGQRSAWPAFSGGPGRLAGRCGGARLASRQPPRALRRPALGLAIGVPARDGLGAGVQGRRPRRGPRGDSPNRDRGRPGTSQRRSHCRSRCPGTPLRPGSSPRPVAADDARSGRAAR